jgi:hypothetical protein
MALTDLTMENLIKEKISYVVPTVGKSFDKLEDAEKLILDTCNIGQYYKFYEVFYSPSLTDRNKRYEKYMMVMTRKTVAIRNEVMAYLTGKAGLNLDAVTDCGDFGYRDTYIVVESPELNTATKVFNQIQKSMQTNGGLEAGGILTSDDKVGTLHLIDALGTLEYASTPQSAKEIFDIFVNFDESKIKNDEEPEPPKEEEVKIPNLDSMYV